MNDLRYKQELKAYRIIKGNIQSWVKDIPFEDIAPLTIQKIISDSISTKKIFDLYLELYVTLGNPIYANQKKQLDNTKDFLYDMFVESVRQWLLANAFYRITSVQDTLVSEIVKYIQTGYAENYTIVQIARKMTKDYGWYKYQTLRIARTETTTINNGMKLLAAQDSNLVLDKVWSSAQDNRTRVTPFDHLDMNGVTVGLNDTFYLGGKDNLQYPGDMKNGSAADIINCRCAMSIVPRRDKDGNLIRKTF